MTSEMPSVVPQSSSNNRQESASSAAPIEAARVEPETGMPEGEPGEIMDDEADTSTRVVGVVVGEGEKKEDGEAEDNEKSEGELDDDGTADEKVNAEDVATQSQTTKPKDR